MKDFIVIGVVVFGAIQLFNVFSNEEPVNDAVSDTVIETHSPTSTPAGVETAPKVVTEMINPVTPEVSVVTEPTQSEQYEELSNTEVRAREVIGMLKDKIVGCEQRKDCEMVSKLIMLEPFGE
tara:strand:- start:4563 stop:4931 length:369 start_codon:yes stop_codon:yes gene_type:complete